MNEVHTPQWADSPEDVQEHINTAHRICCNFPAGGCDGDGIHIGIIDSASSVPEYVTKDTTVHQGDDYSFISAEKDDTTRHGTSVFRRTRAFAPNAEYSLYQAVKNTRQVPTESFSAAVTQAIEDDVDIVNLSFGSAWRHPIQYNPSVKITQRLLDEGIVVVAAAGNDYARPNSDRPPVHCPSAAERVVSVGAMEVHCSKNIGDEPATNPEGPYFWIARGAGPNQVIDPSNGVYCGEQGCCNGESCQDNRNPVPWTRNPKPTGDKPDVLAPMHMLRRKPQSWEYLSVGTSFSAPLVTGSLASLFGLMQRDGVALPRPEIARKAVRTGGELFESSTIPKYDAIQTRSKLLDMV